MYSEEEIKERKRKTRETKTFVMSKLVFDLIWHKVFDGKIKIANKHMSRTIEERFKDALWSELCYFTKQDDSG